MNNRWVAASARIHALQRWGTWRSGDRGDHAIQTASAKKIALPATGTVASACTAGRSGRYGTAITAPPSKASATTLNQGLAAG